MFASLSPGFGSLDPMPLPLNQLDYLDTGTGGELISPQWPIPDLSTTSFRNSMSNPNMSESIVEASPWVWEGDTSTNTNTNTNPNTKTNTSINTNTVSRPAPSTIPPSRPVISKSRSSHGPGLTAAEVYRNVVRPYDYMEGYHFLMEYLTTK